MSHVLIILAIMVSSFITGCLLFVMFGATTVGGITAFGIFYGFFSGASKVPVRSYRRPVAEPSP
jgi:sulfite exporter TauE/SafE